VKKIIKHTIVHYLQNRKTVERSSKIKVLIQLNDYFTKNKWLTAFSSQIEDYEKVFDLHFTSNKFRYIRHAVNANIIFAFSYNEDYIRNNNDLKMFYIGQRGMESLHDDKTITLKGLKIFNIHPIGKEYIADYIIFSIYALTRRLYIPIRNQTKRKWEQKALLSISNKPTNKLIFGIAGVGRIGSTVAEKLSSLGYTVYGWDEVKSKTHQSIDVFFNKDMLSSFLEQIDFLIITLPLNDETRDLFNYEQLVKMKKGSFVVNVSRGCILNENSLLKAIDNEIIEGAALDVFPKEPLSKFSKLWKNDKIIVTPHIAGNINYFVDDIQKDFFDKICGITIND